VPVRLLEPVALVPPVLPVVPAEPVVFFGESLSGLLADIFLVLLRVCV
jgi:hypothetical protein